MMYLSVERSKEKRGDDRWIHEEEITRGEWAWSTLCTYQSCIIHINNTIDSIRISLAPHPNAQCW